jgi:hypothetical protein
VRNGRECVGEWRVERGERRERREDRGYGIEERWRMEDFRGGNLQPDFVARWESKTCERQ